MKSDIINKSDIDKQQFGDDFIWGVSTASPQIEGSWDVDGRGPSVWDVFAQKKGKILNGDKPTISCDFYNRYRDDIDIIKQLNIPNFRFSIAWPRIMPTGIGPVNQAGIDHYNRVIDYCLELGIEPWITVYHWDLPHALEQKGGWTNRDMIGWFSDYVEVCARAFGNRVKHWMVMNEPSVFIGAGYFLGIHAPGRTGMRNFLPAIHHAVLCMAAGGKIIRELCPGAEIGTTFSCSYIEPYSGKKADVDAARRADAFINRHFIEAVMGMGYPDDVKIFREIAKYMKPGDQELMTFDFDFIGLQIYTREIVKAAIFVPYVGARLVKASDRNVPADLIMSINWEVYPPSIYQIIKKYSAYPRVKKIYITENGAAFHDEVINGEVRDTARINYLQQHIGQVLKAKNEGGKVAGYFVWTLTDNFEWAEGYHTRFGLVHVDFKTQQRIIKHSGKWYGRFLEGDI